MQELIDFLEFQKSTVWKKSNSFLSETLIRLKKMCQITILSRKIGYVVYRYGRKIQIFYSGQVSGDLAHYVDVTDLIARLQMMLEVEFSQYLSIFFCHKGIKGEIFQNIFLSFRAVGSGIIFVKSLCSAVMEAWLYVRAFR